MNCSDGIPNPRADGLCCDCEYKLAVTNDNRFCLKCLRKRIRDENPITQVFSDQRGRTARDSKAIGGSPDMRPTGEME